MIKRAISFEFARAQFVHRFTMEHAPAWSQTPLRPGRYYAPQYASDQEWYDATIFPGETIDGITLGKREGHCVSLKATWPLGRWLKEAYKRA